MGVVEEQVMVELTPANFAQKMFGTAGEPNAPTAEDCCTGRGQRLPRRDFTEVQVWR